MIMAAVRITQTRFKPTFPFHSLYHLPRVKSHKVSLVYKLYALLPLHAYTFSFPSHPSSEKKKKENHNSAFKYLALQL